MSASKSLLKVLTTPCKLASALDWKKMSGSTILSLDIHADRIGLARCDHPSSGTIKGFPSSQPTSVPSLSCHPLESLPLDRKSKTISEEAKKKLADLVKDHNVCGFVVSWPMQQDTGRMGASCGRTLFTLEQLMKDNSVFTPNRPLCLWDANHVQPTQMDAFGRSTEFTKTSTKKLHLASQEQYHQDESIAASQVWQDFCQQYWPKDTSEVKTDKVKVPVARPSLVGGGRKSSSSSMGSSWQSVRKTVQAAA
jgi:RNase H-fold protein (predicted Holliday junction resolvase)